MDDLREDFREEFEKHLKEVNAQIYLTVWVPSLGWRELCITSRPGEEHLFPHDIELDLMVRELHQKTCRHSKDRVTNINQSNKAVSCHYCHKLLEVIHDGEVVVQREKTPQ